jgi:hypothetical protein
VITRTGVPLHAAPDTPITKTFKLHKLDYKILGTLLRGAHARVCRPVRDDPPTAAVAVSSSIIGQAYCFVKVAGRLAGGQADAPQHNTRLPQLV